MKWEFSFTSPETVEAVRRAVIHALPGVEECVVQIGQGVDAVSISECQPQAKEPSSARLLALASHPAVLALTQDLHRAASSDPNIGVPQIDAVWCRIRRQRGTPLHTDLPFFAKRQRTKHGIPQHERRCCFCGCHTARVNLCQRCEGGGGGITTVWVPLHDIILGKHSTLYFDGVPVTPASGTAVAFTGDTSHEARPGSERRVSLDFRFAHTRLLRVPLDASVFDTLRSVVAKETLIASSKWRRNEGENMRFLMACVGRAGEDEGKIGVEDFDAVYERRAGSHISGTAVNPPDSPITTACIGDVVHGWLQTNENPGLYVELAAEAACRLIKASRSENGVRLTKSKPSRILQRDVELSLFVTHVVFMATSWLVTPKTWTTGVTSLESRQCIEMYLKASSATLMDSNCESEEFIEIVACAAVLGVAPWPKITPPWLKNSWHEGASAVFEKTAKRQKKSRYRTDVIVHGAYLHAWWQGIS